MINAYFANSKKFKNLSEVLDHLLTHSVKIKGWKISYEQIFFDGVIYDIIEKSNGAVEYSKAKDQANFKQSMRYEYINGKPCLKHN